MHSDFLRGIVCASLAFFVFSLGDGVAKWFSQSLNVASIAFWGYTGGIPVLLLVGLATGRTGQLLATDKPVMHLVRGVFVAAQYLAFILAISMAPLASAYCMIFCAPIFSALLAGPVLGEWPDKSSWAAVIAGFLGVVMILRPGLVTLEPGLLIALFAGFLFACHSIMARYIGDRDNIFPFASYPVIMTVVMLLGYFAVTGNFQTPEAHKIPLIWGTGIASVLGVILISKAFLYAPVPAAASFHYTQLIWGSLIGYFVFHDVPDGATYLGSAIIIAAGMFITWHGHRLDKQKVPDKA